MAGHQNPNTLVTITLHHNLRLKISHLDIGNTKEALSAAPYIPFSPSGLNALLAKNATDGSVKTPKTRQHNKKNGQTGSVSTPAAAGAGAPGLNAAAPNPGDTATPGVR